MTPRELILRGEALRAAVSQLVKHWPLDEKGMRKCPEEEMPQVADFLTEIRKWANSIVLVSRGTLFEEGHKDILQILLRGATHGIGRGIWNENNPNLNRFFDEGISMLHDLPDEGSPGKPGQAKALDITPGTAFILMWMDPDRPDLLDVVEGVKDVFREFGIQAQRADEIEHQGIITEVILSRIRTCEFLFADVSGERPNVYYEIGFAHAIGKRPILFRKEGTKLHFDLSVHNVPAYKNVTELKSMLRRRLLAMTGKAVHE